MKTRQPSGKKDVLAVLSGEDRRSIGRVAAAVTLVLGRPALFRRLIEGLWSNDPVVRMRAADAAEKVSSQKPALLQRFKAELLGLLTETGQQELRWHLAQMVPRLSLTAKERARAAAALRTYLNDRSSIVRTFAMQGLADLAFADYELVPATIQLLVRLTREGTPAMRARGRKLLARLERSQS
jgi:hypothetical protein